MFELGKGKSELALLRKRMIVVMQKLISPLRLCRLFDEGSGL